jgi:hypothetical protein
MKKIVFIAAILVSCLSFKNANAQIRFNVGVNIGSQPDWGPTGYDHADFYYLPDIGVYYNVPAHTFTYFSVHDGGRWITEPNLPRTYGNFDLYHAYKVVVNNDARPWMHDRNYKVKYASYRGRHDQVIIRDSHDAKYRNHWHK